MHVTPALAAKEAFDEVVEIGRDADGRLALHQRPAWIARHTRSGVAGMSMCVMPSGESASTTAFMIAARAPTLPASPAPFAPSGLVFVGTGWFSRSNEHMSDARGMP